MQKLSYPFRKKKKKLKNKQFKESEPKTKLAQDISAGIVLS
jgi:hypothetical protein